MASAISRIHAPSSPTAGSSRTSAATRSGWAAAKCIATALPNECATTTTGSSASSLEQRGQRGHIGVDRPRRVPRRVAVADQIGCGNGDLGQVSVEQVFPTLAVPGESVQRQQPHRAGRAEAVHVQAGHALIVPARRSPAPGRA